MILRNIKHFCFFKDALLKDTNNILVQQTANVQSARQIRFTNIQQITELEPVLKAYIYEAVEVEKAGLKFEFKKTEEFVIAEEFQTKLDENPDLKPTFQALTPGRQRAYILHFSAPKQSKTRASRIEKAIPHIVNRKGLND
jgi:uncharacterized protein YdeI (YjbR/CyaY-like superfamily)